MPDQAARVGSFNPRPAFQPGEAVGHVDAQHRHRLVSIHARLFSRAKPDAGPILDHVDQVSIHARLFSRAKPDAGPILDHVDQVSIHARLFSRAKPPSRACPTRTGLFQSTPGFSAGRSHQHHRESRTVFPVSIHARLFSRAKRSTRQPSRRWSATGFNPRPAFQPGEAYCRCCWVGWNKSFNPRPAFQPGEALQVHAKDRHGLVSIHARLFSRAKRRTQSACRICPRRVSIHARLFSRAKHGNRLDDGDGVCSFNPRPAFQPGEAFGLRYACAHLLRFQSTPGFSAGRSHTLLATAVSSVLFQSTPGFSAGRSPLVPAAVAAGSCFNPRPAFQPGEAWCCRTHRS